MKLFIYMSYTAHFLACFWTFLGKYDTEEGWIINEDPKSDFEHYISALYWVFETFTTVGYGDVGPNTKRNISLLM